MQKRIAYPAMNKRKTGDDAGGVVGAQQGKERETPRKWHEFC
ncbi:hypothetical protein [Brevibacillus centrosporus]|nr:hypothetical protein [Brevibacillus centrosporus]